MARDAATYRGARRNYCIREQGMKWSPEWYYRDHNIDAHKVRPWVSKATRKESTTTSDVHRLLKRGDYGAAMRKVYG